MLRIAAVFLLFCGQSLAQYSVNVIDHGANPAKFNDDGPAFQAALNAAAGGGTVFVPKGHYEIMSRTLTIPPDVSIVGEGFRNDAGSLVYRTGSVGTLFDPDQYWTGSISNASFRSTGHCIDYNWTNQARFDNLYLHAGNGHWGLYGHAATFDCVMNNIRCQGSGWTQNGLMIAGHVSVTGFSAVGCNEAVRLTPLSGGPGASMTSFRIESSRIGVRNGWNADESAGDSTLSLRDGTFEQCGTAIISRGALLLHNVRSWAPSGQFPYVEDETGGIILEAATHAYFQNVFLNSVRNKPTLTLKFVEQSTFRNVSAKCNNTENGWSYMGNAAALNEFKFTNFPD